MIKLEIILNTKKVTTLINKMVIPVKNIFYTSLNTHF